MKMLTKNTILLLTSILFIHLSACNLNEPYEIKKNDVMIKPLEISENISNRSLQYEISYSSQISNSKHNLLFYAASISAPNKGSIQFDTLKVLDISILNSDQLLNECSKSLPNNNELDKRSIKIEYKPNQKQSHLLINNKLYMPNANLKLNSAMYVRALSKNNIYKPIRLFSAKESQINTSVKEPEQKITIEIGCIVYDCNRQNNWDAFFNSKKFKEHLFYGMFVPVSKRNRDNIKIYNF